MCPELLPDTHDFLIIIKYIIEYSIYEQNKNYSNVLTTVSLHTRK